MTRSVILLPIPILYQDAHIVLCVKPVGLLSEDGGLPDRLAEQLGAARVYCVHRLDRDVAGVMAYALNGKTAALLTETFSGHRAVKEYALVCHGVPEPAAGVMTDLLYHDAARNKTYVVNRPRKGVKDARLQYRALAEANAQGDPLSLVRVRIQTGRSHQIRAQFASRGLPLFGDARYGSPQRGADIALWSFRLAFAHPLTGKVLDFSRFPPPAEPWTRFPALDELLKGNEL